MVAGVGGGIRGFWTGVCWLAVLLGLKTCVFVHGILWVDGWMDVRDGVLSMGFFFF